MSKKNMKNETLLRLWLLLQSIPVYPRKITVSQLMERLVSEGFEIHRRTTERDLNDLSLVWPLQVDDRSRPHGWSWNKDAKLFSIPGMSPLQALTLCMAQDHLIPLLPASLIQTLEPYFAHAQKILQSGEGMRTMADWRNKVAIVPASQALLPPQYDENVVVNVHEALFMEKQLEIDYVAHRAEKATHIVHPLALVQRGAVIYLVATMYAYTDIRLLVLHRIKSATILDEPANVPKDFCLQQYIAKGGFGFAYTEDTLRLVVRFAAGAAEHLRETPLSNDQEFLEEGATVLLRATVSDSPQLRWWLRTFGDHVEILEPPSLRDEFVQMLGAMRAVYNT